MAVPSTEQADRADRAAAQPGLPPGRFFDREESWLRFNERVLELAEDPQVPLLERVRFCSIFSSNLDEFFMVRVAGRLRRMNAGLVGTSPSGRSSQQVLDTIAELTRALTRRQAELVHAELLPALAEAGIVVARWDELTETEQDRLCEVFTDTIHPVLTPLVVDQAHPFPYISGQSLNLAVLVRDPGEGTTRLARVKVPPSLPRFLPVSPGRFTLLEDVIGAQLDQLFTGMEIVERHAFRLTRNADLEVDEDITEDLLQALERELARRRFGPAVRLEIEDTISPAIAELLIEELEVLPEQVYRVPGPLDLAGLADIADLDRPELKYRPYIPASRAFAGDGGVFARLRERDVLVHHPYDSFAGSVQRFVEEAAADPAVLAIKQTLYRTSGDSPIVDALIDAAEAGKQVVVIVEIKARFDERANIAWARKLERAGCHVVFGFVDLKTHCKLSLVVRKEADGSTRRYCHVGTGNYHPKTARLYEDLGLLTGDPGIGADVAALFNHLTGFSRPGPFERLLVSPTTVRSGLAERIDAEIAHHRAGRPARIRVKTNAMVDEEIIDALYRAGQAGVPVEVWVRGICALRPGVPGLSESITVRSVLGRFLEHSRVYAFEGGGDRQVWMGSADLMHRNLDRRIEALVRVGDPAAAGYLWELLDLAADPDARTWRLNADGGWTRHTGPGTFDIQERLMSLHRTAAASTEG
jgi:polyphosphate kinase